MNRNIAKTVLVAYNKVASSFGIAQCIDYSRNTGGQGPQYSPDATFNAMNAVEFKVDVERAVEAAVGKELARRILCDVYQWLDNPLRTFEVLEADERMGEVFRERSLQPSVYFRHIKR